MINAVMIDSREPEWVQKLTFNGTPTMVTFLEQGDLMAATDDGQMLLIERKTADDLLNSLRENRLFNQLAEMQDKTRWAYLVITGELQRGPQGKVVTDRGDTGWSWSAVQGALLAVQEMGIFVIHAGSDADYESCILRLGARDRKPDLLIPPVKFPKILSAQEQVVASLPGIGVDRLQAVMSQCGTPAWALVALTDKSTDLPGVGPGIKTKIRAALGLRDADQLSVAVTDEGHETILIQPLGAQ
jgi:ERCC4-type nuclease